MKIKLIYKIKYLQIKDTEKLKIEQNELSQNNIIEYQKNYKFKKINLRIIGNKEKKSNPCNNDNDLITILQTKIKKVILIKTSHSLKD